MLPCLQHQCTCFLQAPLNLATPKGMLLVTMCLKIFFVMENKKIITPLSSFSCWFWAMCLAIQHEAINPRLCLGCRQLLPWALSRAASQPVCLAHSSSLLSHSLGSLRAADMSSEIQSLHPMQTNPRGLSLGGTEPWTMGSSPRLSLPSH